VTEFGDQDDTDNESWKANRRSFGWIAGVLVLAIVLGLVVGVDHGRKVATSNDSATAAMMAAAPLHGSPIPEVTSPRSVTTNRS
jgi:hypothetical protein